MSLLTGGRQTASSKPPRLFALQVQSSAYGTVIPVVIGCHKVPVNVLHYFGFRSVEQTQHVGKGGQDMTTGYAYYASLALGLCDGPVAQIHRVWRDSGVAYPADMGFNSFLGDPDQAAWGALPSNEILNYSGTAYLAATNYPLGESAILGNHNAEVAGFCLPTGFNYLTTYVKDVSPADIVTFLVTDEAHGGGLDVGLIDSASFAKYKNYCAAMGIAFSMAMTSQQALGEWCERITDASNTAIVYSAGKIKAVPRGDTAITANGATYTPDNTAVADLLYDDFLEPIKVSRKAQSETYNKWQVEFSNRENSYNQDVEPVDDGPDISRFGLREKEPETIEFICDRPTARKVAQLKMQRNLYIRNSYDFRLSPKWQLLEPMDIVTLTEPEIGLDQHPVRITEITEDEDGALSVVAEEYPQGVAHCPDQYSQVIGGYTGQSKNAPAGSVNTPLLFVPPLDMTENKPTLAMAISGPWGGPLFEAVNIAGNHTTSTTANGHTVANSGLGVITATLRASAFTYWAETGVGLRYFNNSTLLAGTICGVDGNNLAVGALASTTLPGISRLYADGEGYLYVFGTGTYDGDSGAYIVRIGATTSELWYFSEGPALRSMCVSDSGIVYMQRGGESDLLMVGYAGQSPSIVRADVGGILAMGCVPGEDEELYYSDGASIYHYVIGADPALFAGHAVETIPTYAVESGDPLTQIFGDIAALAATTDGTVYVLDSLYQCVWQVSATGCYRIAGTGTMGDPPAGTYPTYTEAPGRSISLGTVRDMQLVGTSLFFGDETNSDIDELSTLSADTPEWGGADVWMSYDGTSYKRIGTVKAPSICGQLTEDLAEFTGTNPDGSTLHVALNTDGQLTSVSTESQQAEQSLCYVDGEYLAFSGAALSGAREYALTVLNRGLHESEAAEHVAGTGFASLENIFTWPIPDPVFGLDVFLKFTSFNYMGSGAEDLADVQAYKYTLPWWQFLTAPARLRHENAPYIQGLNILIAWEKMISPTLPIGFDVEIYTADGVTLLRSATSGQRYNGYIYAKYVYTIEDQILDGGALSGYLFKVRAHYIFEGQTYTGPWAEVPVGALLDPDVTLGGAAASDQKGATQKAIKEAIDAAGGGGSATGAYRGEFFFALDGNAYVGDDVRYSFPAPSNGAFTEWVMECNEAPVGADLIVNVTRVRPGYANQKIFLTANRPTIAAGTTFATGNTFDFSDIASSDRYQFDIEQVGTSSGVGIDVMLTLKFNRASLNAVDPVAIQDASAEVSVEVATLLKFPDGTLTDLGGGVVEVAIPTGGSGDVTGPATNSADYVPQWDGANSKTLKNGLAVGTGANNLLQLDASAKLPAVDASQLTNLPAATSGGSNRILGYICTPPESDDFAWNNHNNATMTSFTSSGQSALVLYVPGIVNENGYRLSSIEVAIANEEWEYYAAVSAMLPVSGYYNFCGMCIRDSQSGKLMVLGFYQNGNNPTISVYSVPSVSTTTFTNHASSNSFPLGIPVILKIKQTATEYEFYFSCDGIYFYKLYNCAHTYTLTNHADKLGLVGTGYYGVASWARLNIYHFGTALPSY